MFILYFINKIILIQWYTNFDFNEYTGHNIPDAAILYFSFNHELGTELFFILIIIYLTISTLHFQYK